MVTSTPDSGLRVVLTAMRVLEAVSELQPVGVPAIACCTGVPQSSGQRCLVTLRARAGNARCPVSGAVAGGSHPGGPPTEQVAHDGHHRLREEER